MITINLSNAVSFYKYGVEQPSQPVINYCINNIKFNGTYLEFGIWTGTSTNFIADKIRPTTLHAFDSFKGLGKEWNRLDKDFFKVDPSSIRLRNNVKVYKGFFSDTIPNYLSENNKPIAFINVDCDLYESTRDVLTGLNERIVPGTLIYFDELYNYPDYMDHEYKALKEWVRDFKRGIRYIAYNDDMGVAIEVLR